MYAGGAADVKNSTDAGAALRYGRAQVFGDTDDTNRPPRRLAGACALALALAPAATADARLGDLDPAFGGGDGIASLDAARRQRAAGRDPRRATARSWPPARRWTARGRQSPDRPPAADGARPRLRGRRRRRAGPPARRGRRPRSRRSRAATRSSWPAPAATGSLTTRPALPRPALPPASTSSPRSRGRRRSTSALTDMEALADGDIVRRRLGHRRPRRHAGHPPQRGRLSGRAVQRRGQRADGGEDFAKLPARHQALTVDATGRDHPRRRVDRGAQRPARRRGARDAHSARPTPPSAATASSRSTTGRSPAARLAGAARTAPPRRGPDARPAGRPPGDRADGAPRHGTAGAPLGAAIWPGRRGGRADLPRRRRRGRADAGNALQTAWLTATGTPTPRAAASAATRSTCSPARRRWARRLGPGDALVVAGTSAAGQGVVARFAPNAAPGPRSPPRAARWPAPRPRSPRPARATPRARRCATRSTLTATAPTSSTAARTRSRCAPSPRPAPTRSACA